QEAIGGVFDLGIDHLEDLVLGGRSLEQALAERVDPLALLVHDLVVLEQVLANIEVPLLDFLLGSLDAPADHLALDGLAFLHAQPGEDGRYPLAGELAHQVVFQREEEPRRARVSLAAGPAAQLIVDAPAFVPLGADDVQAPAPATSRPSAFISGSYLDTAFCQTSLETSSRVSYLSRPSSSVSRLRPAPAMNSGLPPRMMSVPRPAMLVAIVTPAWRPA